MKAMVFAFLRDRGGAGDRRGDRPARQPRPARSRRLAGSSIELAGRLSSFRRRPRPADPARARRHGDAGADDGGPAGAAPHHHHAPSPGGARTDPEQVTRLEAIRGEFAREAIRRDADIRIAELDLATLLEQDPVDLAKAEAKTREVAQLRVDLQMARLRAVEQGKAVLTADQRARLSRC